MLRFTTGNLLASDAEALVNTVNTVGVMGKGIALMFKERFPDNFKAYQAACKAQELRVGRMLVVPRNRLGDPKWIINFPTKEHWRSPSRIEWVEAGLRDLVQVIEREGIRSIAIPPLGAGNGKLDWHDVRPLIEQAFTPLQDVQVTVFEPTMQYQNVVKRSGVEKLTPARALVADLIRRYWVHGMECSLLEIQKLAYFLERCCRALKLDDVLDLRFTAHSYGPYANRLQHMLNSLDGSYLHCEKRIGDAGPFDTIWFNEERADKLNAFLSSPDMKPYRPALEATAELIQGFESPFGLELLATVDWLVHVSKVDPDVASIRRALGSWGADRDAAERKSRLFEDRVLALSLEHLKNADPARMIQAVPAE